jgi:hypothetical protein
VADERDDVRPVWDADLAALHPVEDADDDLGGALGDDAWHLAKREVPPPAVPEELTINNDPING